MTVNIYVETSIRGPRCRGGRYIYLLEARIVGRTVTRFGTGKGEPEDTENRLVLKAVNAALGRMKKPSQIVVITTCAHIRNVIENCWAERWQETGWKNAKGKPVSDRELWEVYLREARPHFVGTSIRPNNYKGWMIRQLETGPERISNENN